MVDAATLALPDSSGSQLWRPARLEDIYAIPQRCWDFYMRYRSGLAERGDADHQKAFGEIGGVAVV